MDFDPEAYGDDSEEDLDQVVRTNAAKDYPVLSEILVQRPPLPHSERVASKAPETPVSIVSQHLEAGFFDTIRNPSMDSADLYNSPSFDWCRFRRESRCFYPKDVDQRATQQAGYPVFKVMDRGHCPRDSWKEQKNCPISEPGPNSKHPDAQIEVTMNWEEGGQRNGRPAPRIGSLAGPTSGPWIDTMASVDELKAIVMANNLDPSSPKIQALAEDIASHGIKEPLMVEDTNKGPFLSDGTHRLYAAELAGIREIPVRIFANTDEGRSAARREIVQRERMKVGTLRAAQASFEFTAAWRDIQAKAKRIRGSSGVKIIASTDHTMTATVQGDSNVYQTTLMRVPGTKRTALWECSCFHPDAPVTMADGREKSISEVVEGDYVLTHTGQIQRVVKAWSRPWDGDMTTIKVAGDYRKIIATHNHPFFVADKAWAMGHESVNPQTRYDHLGSLNPTDGVVGWKEIGQIEVGDYVSFAPPLIEEEVLVSYRKPRYHRGGESGSIGVYEFNPSAGNGQPKWAARMWDAESQKMQSLGYFPKTDEGRSQAAAAAESWMDEHDIRQLKIDNSLAWLLGAYAAEGSTSRNTEVIFALGSHEIEFATRIQDICEEYFGTRGSLRIPPTRPDVFDLRVSSWLLKSFVEDLVGRGSRDKSLDSRIINLPLSTQMAFIEGLEEGDGWKPSEGTHGHHAKRHRIGLANEVLIRQLRTILARQGVRSWVTHTESNPGGLESTKNGGPIWSITWTDHEKWSSRQFFRDGRMWYKVESVESSPHQGEVWDMEIEEDHSFTCFGVSVHNCAWSAYSWGRSGRWKQYEGRMCSHALALTYEASSQEWGGGSVKEGPGHETSPYFYEAPQPGQWRASSLSPKTASMLDGVAIGKGQIGRSLRFDVEAEGALLEKIVSGQVSLQELLSAGSYGPEVGSWWADGDEDEWQGFTLGDLHDNYVYSEESISYNKDYGFGETSISLLAEKHSGIGPSIQGGTNEYLQGGSSIRVIRAFYSPDNTGPSQRWFEISPGGSVTASAAEDFDAPLLAVQEIAEDGDFTHSGLIIKSADSGRVLLTQRTPYHEDAEGIYGRWEFPGGGIDEGETALDSAIREFQEETGLDLPEDFTIKGHYINGPYMAIVAVVPNEAWTTNAELLSHETMGIGWFDLDMIEQSDLARQEIEETDWDMVREASRQLKSAGLRPLSVSASLAAAPIKVIGLSIPTEEMAIDDEGHVYLNGQEVREHPKWDPSLGLTAARETIHKTVGTDNLYMLTSNGGNRLRHISKDGFRALCGTTVNSPSKQATDQCEAQALATCDRCLKSLGRFTASVVSYQGGHMPADDGPPVWDLTRPGEWEAPSDIYDHLEQYTHFDRGPLDTIRRVRGDRSARVTIYRSVPAGVTAINDGDWVALSRAYAQTHTDSNGDRDWVVLSAEVSADDVLWAGDDLAEWGYFGAPITNARTASRALLNEEPEAALPRTDGAAEDEAPEEAFAEMADEVDSPEEVSSIIEDVIVEESDDEEDPMSAEAVQRRSASLGGDDGGDIASAAAAHLEKTSAKVFTPLEQQQLIDEGEGVLASNFDSLNITGTHYELVEAQQSNAYLDDLFF